MLVSQIKKIGKIKFGLLSPDIIRKMSVCNIITADTYHEDGTPVENGLMDRRLGTIEPGQRCRTCGNQIGDCPGHFGRIELTRPVIHVGLAKTVVFKLLKITCRECSRIRLEDRELRRYFLKLQSLSNFMEDRQKIIDVVVAKAKRVMKCPHCGAEQFKIKYEKPTTFSEETPEGLVKLSPQEIAQRFEKIPDSDLMVVGIDPEYARPEWAIITVLPVPPASVRASITLESGIRSEDDLTHKLVDIIRINQRLRENIEGGAPQLIVEDLSELLQYHVTTYFDNEVAGIPPARHRSGRSLRTLTQRLKGKEGRFRGNLSGKRVDFSARTVISPDPYISINEVGVPEEIAKILTVPERVTEWNIEEMKELVINGPSGYPGANYVIRPDGKRRDLRFVESLQEAAEEVGPGYTIERHLRDGDLVLFNRQPSLHRMSIMAHQARIMPYKTFRLNLAVCTPYNADFDGDEMNLHIPQSEEARSEARVLMLVQEQILSPRYGGPIIGALHDYVSAAFLLTYKKTLLTRQDVWQLLMSGNYQDEQLFPPAIEYPVKRWTGKQVFSMLLPPEVNITTNTRKCVKHESCDRKECNYDSYLRIRNGIILTGYIDRRAIGADETESLLHLVVKDLGSEKARIFIDSFTRVLLEFITHKGFSIGFRNVVLPAEAREKIKDTLHEAEEKVNALIREFHNKTLEPSPGRTLRETLEDRIMEVLTKARDEAGRIASKYFTISNSMIVMIKAGARGSDLNVTQMAACVGQQSIRGQRVLRGYRKRSLPHFKKGDITAFGRGFVRANFRDGLTPLEFFFHAQGGREGLVDTAVRTSTSGYLQRRLINALQDLTVHYDGVVRSPSGQIIQLKYGEDGIDPMKSFHGKSVDIKTIIEDTLYEYGINPEEFESEPWSEEQIREYVNSFDVLPIKVRNDLVEAILQLETSLQKQKIVENITINTIDAFTRAQVDPGEAIGTVAAQSIGEPGTQMSLPGTEKVLIKMGNITKITPIGPFIDSLLNRLPATTHVTSAHGSTIADIPENLELYVPALTDKEKIEWHRVIQVSRHPPNGKLLKITTKTGRTIIATLSHSFVVRKENKILPIKGRNLRIGDRLPIVRNLPSENPLRTIPLGLNEARHDQVSPPTSKHADTGLSQHTISHAPDTAYLQPEILDPSDSNIFGTITTETISPLSEGQIMASLPITDVPSVTSVEYQEYIELDFITGWIIGHYLLNGSTTRDKVIIKDLDDMFVSRIRNFAEKYHITYRLEPSAVEENKVTVHFDSKGLATFLTQLSGVSYDKRRIPDWSLNANTDFITGLLRGLFDLAGKVRIQEHVVKITLSSKDLIDGISLLLSRLGVLTRKEKSNKEKYSLIILPRYIPRFYEKVNTDLADKKESLLKMIENVERRLKAPVQSVADEFDDVIPGIGMELHRLQQEFNLPDSDPLAEKIRTYTERQEIQANELERILTAFKELTSQNEKELEDLTQPLEQALKSDVFWDEIIKLELVDSPTEHVYDFSVDKFETFVTAEGIVTHNTLKTFHYAGVREFNVTLGLPRLLEILDARKNPSSPFMKIYLLPPYNKDRELALQVQRRLELTTVETVCESFELDLAQMQIILNLDQKLMEDKGITVDLITEKLEKNIKKAEITYDSEYNEIVIDPNVDQLDDLYKINEKVKQIELKGLKGLTRVMVKKEQDSDEWVLLAEGSNLSGVLRVEGVDPARVYTNNIYEIQLTFGIEAARQAIIDEAQEVLNNQGLDVDIRHIMLVADLMTYKGEVTQLGRHGISGEKESSLARASFEVTVRHLLDAATAGEVDPLRGVTENVIIGQIIPLGTGIVELIMQPGMPEAGTWESEIDMEWLKKLEEDLKAEEKAEEEEEVPVVELEEEEIELEEEEEEELLPEEEEEVDVFEEIEPGDDENI